MLVTVRALVAAGCLLVCSFTLVADRRMADFAESPYVVIARLFTPLTQIVGTPVPVPGGAGMQACSVAGWPTPGTALLVSVRAVRQTNPNSASAWVAIIPEDAP